MKYIFSTLMLLTAAVSLWAQTENKEQTDTPVTSIMTAPLIGNADTVSAEQYKAKVPECVEIHGVCWATRNVDAPGTFTQTPEDAGMFYQWNRKTAWNATDSIVTGWDSFIPAGTAWEKSNDPCPAGYRLPTQAEQTALVNAGSTWTANYNGNGVAGRIFGSGTAVVFFPAAGYRGYGNGALYSAGTHGGYWSSTHYDSSYAYSVYFNSSYAGVNNSSRYNGLSVRCVSE